MMRELITLNFFYINKENRKPIYKKCLVKHY